MLKYTWVVIYGIFCTTAATISFGKLNGKDKSVNLALETVFEFGDDDKKGDVNILNSVQKFIGKVKNVIENSNGGRRHLLDDNKRFTSFIIDVIRILKQYDDQDLEQIAFIVGDEVKHHHRKGSQLHDLTKSLGVHDNVAKKLSEIKKKTAIDIRDYLDSVANKIDKEKYLKHEKRFLEAINSVYTADSTIKLNSFLTDLDDYRIKARKNMDLTKIITGGLKSIFFDHYNNLSPNLRSSFLSDLDAIFDQLFSGFEKIADKNTHSKAVTKTTDSQRTSRQMYVEKNLDLNYIKNAFEKWISEGVNKEKKTKDRKGNTRSDNSHGRNKHKTRGIAREKSTAKTRTPMTKRPHNVPTTRRPVTEYHSALRSYGNHNYRFSKVNRYRKHKTETTKQYRTLRQMYVEKNIDLKYDPDAYENLTTANKVRTTRKHVKSTYKDEEDSYEKPSDKEETVNSQYAREHGTDEGSEETAQNPSKKGKIIESVLSDFMIELSTEVHAPSITKSPEMKLTRMERSFDQTLVDKDLDYAEDMTPRFRSNRKSFSTPNFLIDWSTKKPRRIIKRIVQPAPKYRQGQLNRGSVEDTEFYTHKVEAKREDLKTDRDLDYSIEVKKDKYLERSRINKQNYRNQAEHNSKDYARDSRVHLGKVVNRYHGNVPLLRQERESLSGKLKITRSPLILAKYYGGSHSAGKHHFRRSNSKSPYKSEEGLSIETDDNNKKSNRRQDNSNTALKIDGNKQFLKRLQKLEDELEIVKTQIRNDTNAVKDLIENSRKDNNMNDNILGVQSNNGKVNQLQKAITGFNSKPNLDTETVTKLKSINVGGFNMDIPQIYKTNIYDLNKQSIDLTKGKEFIDTKYDPYRVPYENPSKVDSTVVKNNKEEYLQNVNKEEHGRKAFLDLKKTEENKYDELKTYEKPSNYDAINNIPKMNIETRPVTSKIKETLSDISKKYKDSSKDRQDRAIYFRVNDDSNESTFNETAYETLKDKYGFNVNSIKNDANQNQNDTKVFNNQATGIYEDDQLNDDSQTKATIKKSDLDDHVADITQTNSSKDVKHDEMDDYNRVSFIGRQNDILDKNNTTGDDLTTKIDELSKINDENIVTSDKIVTVTPINNVTTGIVPGTNTLPGHLMNQLIKEIGGHLAALPDAHGGNIGQRSVGKEADVNMLLNTMKSDGIKNETLPIQQNLLNSNVGRPMNVSITF